MYSISNPKQIYLSLVRNTRNRRLFLTQTIVLKLNLSPLKNPQHVSYTRRLLPTYRYRIHTEQFAMKLLGSDIEPLQVR